MRGLALGAVVAIAQPQPRPTAVAKPMGLRVLGLGAVGVNAETHRRRSSRATGRWSEAWAAAVTTWASSSSKVSGV